MTARLRQARVVLATTLVLVLVAGVVVAMRAAGEAECNKIRETHCCGGNLTESS